jgi:predicted Zn-dependent protease
VARNQDSTQTPPAVIAEKKYRSGVSYYEIADYHRAVENLREAVRLAPSNIPYHKLLGQALAKNPKWRKQAEGHFHLVLKAVPYDTECYLELASFMKKKACPGVPRKCMSRCSRSIRITR